MVESPVESSEGLYVEDRWLISTHVLRVTVYVIKHRTKGVSSILYNTFINQLILPFLL
jgi:hypothetical protein